MSLSDTSLKGLVLVSGAGSAGAQLKLPTTLTLAKELRKIITSIPSVVLSASFT